MATPARLDRLPAKESHGTALQESLRRYPMAVCVSVWHFGLTRSKNRALNSPVHGHVLSPDGTTSTALIDGVGKATFDGAGNLTQEESTVVNGVKVSGGPANASFSTGETGTYIVDADCTGMMTLYLGPGGTRAGAFVITRRGQA